MSEDNPLIIEIFTSFLKKLEDDPNCDSLVIERLRKKLFTEKDYRNIKNVLFEEDEIA